MADLTSEDINKLVDSLNTLNRSVLKSSKLAATHHTQQHKQTASSQKPQNNHASDTALKRFIDSQNKMSLAASAVTGNYKKMDSATTSAVGKFKEFNAAADTATGGLKTFASMLGAGGVIAMIASTLDNTIKTYQNLTEVGQSFGGSMLNMQIAAAQAALPLDQFAKVVTANSKVVAGLGTKAFIDMSKQLRISMMDVGQLGMTTEQLNGFMGNYMETQRLMGALDNQSTEKSVAAMKSLAIETTKMAQMTGVSRSQIAEQSNKAMKDESLRAASMMLSGNAQNAFSLSMAKATTYMAALPGEAGKTLSTMLAQSVGRGSAMLSDSAQTFVDAGMFGITDLMDNMAKKAAAGDVSAEDQAEFNRRFLAEGEKNLTSLKFQASTGNKAAAQVIDMISEMKNLAKKSPQQIAEETKMTKFMSNFSTIIDRISGKLRVSFFEGLDRVLTGMENFTESPAFATFLDQIGKMASEFGTFLGGMLKPERLEELGKTIGSTLIAVAQFGSMMLSLVSTLGSTVGWITEKFSLLGFTLTAMGLWIAKNILVSKVKDRLAEGFTIGGRKIGGGGSPEDRTGKAVGSAFSAALAKYASGSSLRVLMNQTNRGGGAAPHPNNPNHPDHPNHPTNRRQRRLDRVNNRTGQPNISTPTHRTGKGRKFSISGFGNILGGNTAGNEFAQALAMYASGGALRVVMGGFGKGGGGGGFDMGDLLDNGKPHNPRDDVRKRRMDRLRDAHRASQPRSRMGKLWDGTKRVGTKIGDFASRSSTTIRSATSRIPTSKFTRGVGKVGKTIAKGGASLAKGGMSLVKGIGPAAMAGAGVALALSYAPDFKGKATLQAMAEYGALGSMLGPVGAAVGAGVGAVVANWDDITDVVGRGFNAISNFDYAGGIKAVGSAAVAPIVGAFNLGKKAANWAWDGITSVVSSGYKAIGAIDYSNKFVQAGMIAGPVGMAIGVGVSSVVKNWGTISSKISSGFKTLGTMDYSKQLLAGGLIAGPVGASVALGVGAVVKNWDSISKSFTSGMKNIREYDYAGALKKAKNFVAPIGTAFTLGRNILEGAWTATTNVITDGFKAIGSYDYSGALKKVKDFVAPVGTALTLGRNLISGTWNAVTNLVTDGFKAIGSYDYAGAITKVKDFFAPVGNAFKAGKDVITKSWTAVTDLVTNGFKAIGNYDYSGALTKAKDFVAPISTAFTTGRDLISNSWSSLTNMVTDGFKAIGSYDYSGALTKAKDFVAPIGTVISDYVSTIGKGWDAIGSSVVGGFTSLKNMAFPEIDSKDTSTGLFDSVTKYASSLVNSVTPSLAGITKSMNDVFDNKTVNLAKPTIGPIDTPTSPKRIEKPEFNTDINNSANTELKQQNANMMKENALMRAQLNKLMETIAQGNMENSGGLRDMISEQRKGNKDLTTMAGNII